MAQLPPTNSPTALPWGRRSHDNRVLKMLHCNVTVPSRPYSFRQGKAAAMGMLLQGLSARWRHLRVPAVAITFALISAAAWAQESPPIAAPAATPVVESLPRDLSPWGMYLNADPVVKGVLIGLFIASIVTWTIWLAKTIELFA